MGCDLSAESTRWGPLQNVSPVGIFHTDANGRCLSVNVRWCEITGLEAEEALGEGWARAVHPDDRERITERWSRAILEENQAFEAQFRFRRPDGVITPVLAQTLPERDARGRICGYIGATVDLTGQIEAENQLRRLALQLELEQERERRRIAAGLHDEVGQLLAVARAKLGQLIETRADGDAPARAAEIRALVDRAIEQTSTLTFELSSPILRELGLVAAVESLCEKLEEESGVRFRVTAEPEPEALGEDLHIFLYRVVRELCTNVVRHARALCAEVRVYVDEDRIQIIVTDDGEGFDAPQDAKSFGPSGGFGLFAIREISRQLGGDFKIESAPGKQTRCILSVPLSGNAIRVSEKT
jgi:PAS domain S-box-containing protein